MTAERRDEYEVGNRIIAAQILADPERYGGDESLAVRWARQVMGRKSDDGHQND